MSQIAYTAATTATAAAVAVAMYAFFYATAAATTTAMWFSSPQAVKHSNKRTTRHLMKDTM